MYASRLIGARMDLEALGFEERPLRRETPHGGVFFRRRYGGMPKIPKNFLSSVFFLYKTREDAETATNEGGTGFIVPIRSADPCQSHLYFITNWHVAIKCGYPVVRLDTRSGEPAIFDFDCADWYFLTDYDIAVVPVELDPGVHDAVAVPVNCFMQEEYAQEHDIGPGEDVFMIGKFIDHKGASRNVPALRFGNISMAPAPLEQANGNMADSYCIDMHSRSGYSGSPVFVYRTPGYDLGELLGAEGESSALMSGASLVALLGIHWGQFPEIWEIEPGDKPRHQDEGEGSQPLNRNNSRIKGVSGMTCVLPAWYILEVLNMPKLKKKRDIEDARLRQTKGDIPIAEASGPEEGDSDNGDAILEKMLNTPSKPHD